jgi:hypothetical protein
MTQLKKLLFVFGTLSLMLLTFSYLAFALGWGSAQLLRSLGFIMLAFVMVAGAVKQKSFIMYAGSIALLFVVFSFIFKAIGIPGVEVLLTAGIMIFTFVFLPMAGFWMYKHSKIGGPEL